MMDKFKLDFLVVLCLLLPPIFKAETCEVSQSCFRSPDDCFPASTCTYFVGWSLSNSGDALDFELTIPGDVDYIALGFSVDGSMPMSDIIVCLSDGSIVRYYASSRSSPSRETDVGLSNAEVIVGDGNTIHCSFTRQLSLNGETNYYNLNENHFLILAQGILTNNNGLGYHNQKRWQSPVSYDLKAADFRTMTTQRPVTDSMPSIAVSSFPDATVSVARPPTTLPPAPENVTTSVVLDTTAERTTRVIPADDDTCGVSQSCFRSPDNCFPASSCTYFVGWSLFQNKEALDFEFSMSGDNGYIALGFSKDGEMTNSDILACLSNNDLNRYYASGRSTPTKHNDNGISNEEVVVGDGGIIKCSFTRQLTLDNQPNFFDLNENHFLILAKGVHQGGAIQQHATHYNYKSSFDFTSAPISVSGSGNGDSDYQTKIKAHGSLMIIGWIGFVSIGIITARFFKQAWPNTKICGKPLWFRIHSMCMITAWVVFISSFALIFITVEGWVGKDRGDSTFYHAIIGTAAVGLGTLNPIMAIFRPHPGTPRRPVFNVLHFAVGFLGWLCANVATFYGVRIYYMDIEKATDIDAFNVLIGFAVFLVMMCIAFELHARSTKEVTAADEHIALDPITATPFEEQNRNMSTRGTQEKPGSAVRNILYVLYVLGVSLTVVYLVVTIAIKDE